MKILFAGENPGGSANYYMAAFNWMKARVTHVPSGQSLPPKLLNQDFDAYIFSDFSKGGLSAEAERKVVERVGNGAGLGMIGGWGSFQGPFGLWRNSRIEQWLPVQCMDSDDRVNYPQGAYPVLKNPHPILGKISLENPPMICGLNRFKARKDAVVVLSAAPVSAKASGKLKLKLQAEVPFLVASSGSRIRASALATDLAPHWCGGFVDWGPKRMKLPVNPRVRVEVGNIYVDFIAGMVRWLAGKA